MSETEVPRVHIYRNWKPLCGFSELDPAYWPQGHRWVPDNSKYLATCDTCKTEAEKNPLRPN